MRSESDTRAYRFSTIAKCDQNMSKSTRPDASPTSTVYYISNGTMAHGPYATASEAHKHKATFDAEAPGHWVVYSESELKAAPGVPVPESDTPS